ncbi:MAG: hypothetical protein QNJ54_08525 [Prochloraceae cyanobacterium]|nr:hypothetical protein [Prochloraceae cyanobacterium]
MSTKIKYALVCFTIVSTATLTVTYWHLGMAVITGFLLAYLSKGSRKYRQPKD